MSAAFAIVYSRACLGLDAPSVVVETHLSNGLPRFTIVGLPEAAVKESKDRVRSALLQSGFVFPRKRITVNLAPADLPKEGGRFDLPIAISILLASEQLACLNIETYELCGELSLSGALRPIKGILPLARATQQNNRALLIPEINCQEAAWVKSLQLFGASNLLAATAHLSGKQLLSPKPHHTIPIQLQRNRKCLSEVCGQHFAKRALTIAAAGGHSMLMTGPPGTGKTLLASRLGALLPDLNHEEALEIAAIYSISALGFHPRTMWERPFRQPHHTGSAIALVGGGRKPVPGEISLAHQGVLFLDELPEFSRQVLEVLREPLESGSIHLSRAAGHAEFPANCQLIAAMNPCPCGYLTDPKQACHCTAEQIQRYRNKISGPLLDRIDIHIEVPPIQVEQLANFDPKSEETSQTVKKRVVAAREIQQARSQKLNAKLTTTEVNQHCALDAPSTQLLNTALEKLGISARGYHKILKVARTIADLENATDIASYHVAEALGFRKQDRNYY